MRTTPDPYPYRGFRFPAELIAHAVWLYHCFSLSLREVELILAQRGIVVSYESIRAWGLRFGRAFANSLKRRRPKPGDKWHLDEVFIRIRDKLHYLWRGRCQVGGVRTNCQRHCSCRTVKQAARATPATSRQV